MRLRVHAGLHGGLCDGRDNSTTAYYAAELLGSPARAEEEMATVLRRQVPERGCSSTAAMG